jgi:hypothetical protein
MKNTLFGVYCNVFQTTIGRDYERRAVVTKHSDKLAYPSFEAGLKKLD